MECSHLLRRYESDGHQKAFDASSYQSNQIWLDVCGMEDESVFLVEEGGRRRNENVRT